MRHSIVRQPKIIAEEDYTLHWASLCVIILEANHHWPLQEKEDKEQFRSLGIFPLNLFPCRKYALVQCPQQGGETK